MRPTRQRLAVVEAMGSFDDFRSAQEIHDLLSPELQQRMMAKVERIQDWYSELLREGIARGA